jgi:NADH dehydrogenase (ubiquinone) 1 alpha subcomplex subunit 4
VSFIEYDNYRQHKSNPHPWQEIKDGEQVKLIALHQKYDHRWERKNW